MNIFNQGSIRKQVMAAIEAKIQSVEEMYKEDVERLEKKLEQDKETSLKSHVDMIIGKII